MSSNSNDITAEQLLTKRKKKYIQRTSKNKPWSSKSSNSLNDIPYSTSGFQKLQAKLGANRNVSSRSSASNNYNPFSETAFNKLKRTVRKSQHELKLKSLKPKVLARPPGYLSDVISNPSENVIISSGSSYSSVEENPGESSSEVVAPPSIVPKVHSKIKRINRFRKQFERLFSYHDSEEKYYLEYEMILPYLESNLLVGNTWKNIFFHNRFLLYLDQFVNFIKSASKNNNIQEFIEREYFTLPCANQINSDESLLNASEKDKLSAYSKLTYNAIEGVISSFNQPRKIDDIAILYSHGSLETKNKRFFKVPDNVIIGFITPINKLGTGGNDNPFFLKLFDVIQEYEQKHPDFINNPACHLRYDDCLKQVRYYYPGQLIPDYIFSINLSVDWENTNLGYYNNINDIKQNNRNELFNKSDNQLITSIHDLFENKTQLITNKLIYINCCRKIDFFWDKISVEFLYRYEHIITYINISECLEIPKQNYEKCKDDNNQFLKIQNKQTFAKSDNTKYQYFFDSALSYSFLDEDRNLIKKGKYLLKNYENWIATLKNISKSKQNYQYLVDMILNLLSMINADKNAEENADKNDLYLNRLMELFSYYYQTNIHFIEKFFKEYPFVFDKIICTFDSKKIPDSYSHKIIVPLINNPTTDFALIYLDLVQNDIAFLLTNNVIDCIDLIDSNDKARDKHEKTKLTLKLVMIVFSSNEIDKIENYPEINQYYIVLNKIYLLIKLFQNTNIYQIICRFSNMLETYYNSFISVVFWFIFNKNKSQTKLIEEHIIKLFSLYTIDPKTNQKKYIFNPINCINPVVIQKKESPSQLGNLIAITEKMRSPLVYLLLSDYFNNGLYKFNSGDVNSLLRDAIKEFKNNEAQMAHKLSEFLNDLLYISIFLLFNNMLKHTDIVYTLLKYLILYPKNTDLFVYLYNGLDNYFNEIRDLYPLFEKRDIIKPDIHVKMNLPPLQNPIKPHKMLFHKNKIGFNDIVKYYSVITTFFDNFISNYLSYHEQAMTSARSSGTHRQKPTGSKSLSAEKNTIVIDNIPVNPIFAKLFPDFQL